MKNFIILFLSMFFILPCVHSQALQKAIPVDVPVNCPKATSVEKLKRHNYAIYKTSEEDGFKILSYSRDYDGSCVDLFEKNGTVKKAQWYVNKEDEISRICLELEEEYNLRPYHHTEYRSEYVDIDWYYYYYKGNTLIVKTTDDDRLFFRRNRFIIDPHTLTIISNTDAASHIEETESLAKQEKEKTLQKEQQEKERQEREQREQLEQKRREQEQLERTRKAEAKRKREADSIAHINVLISSYSSCRFLFENENDYVACVTGKQQPKIESEIKQLISKKMNEISRSVKNGKELKIDKNGSGAELLRVCNLCQKNGSISLVNYDKYIKTLADYTESQLESFVANRKALNKAYIKAKKQDPNIKYSEFLGSYINDNKNRTEVTSNRIFAMANLAYSNAPQYSFGLTIGAAKTFGWYVSLNSDLMSIFNNKFKYNIADYECDYLGTINELPSEYSFSGNKSTSRFGAVAGMIYNLIGPMYAYAGGGYGLRNVFWELENGKWAKCTDDSYQGVAFDAGLMLSSGNYGLSFGIQTIGVKYVEAKIGIGISF